MEKQSKSSSPLASGKLSAYETEELCKLICGLSPEQLQELHNKFKSPRHFAKVIAALLPDSIRMSANKDDRLSNNLGPVIQTGIQSYIKKNPKRFSALISSVVGPAIRASVINTVRDYIISVDRVLQQRFSLTSVKWRIEAWRSGQSLTDVILYHTIYYRVEHLLIIKKDDGILLCNVSAPGISNRGPDVISGMLNVIRDLINDSFGVNDQDSLGEINLGNLTIRMFDSENVILVAAIRGTVSGSIAKSLQDAIDIFAFDYEDALLEFNGEVNTFKSFEPELESCLKVKFKENESTKRKSFFKWYILLFLLITGLIYWSISNYLDKSEWEKLLQDFDNTPGVVVVENTWSKGNYQIQALRDPLSVDPYIIIDKQSRLKDKSIEFKSSPYISVDRPIVIKRIKDRIQIPKTVSMSLDSFGTLTLRGAASKKWVESNLQFIKIVPGVNNVDLNKLKMLEDIKISEFEQILRTVSETQIKFNYNETSLNEPNLSNYKITQEKIVKLLKLGKELSFEVNVYINAYSGTTGIPTKNTQLALERISYIENLLTRSKISTKLLSKGKIISTEEFCDLFPKDCNKDIPCGLFQFEIGY